MDDARIGTELFFGVVFVQSVEKLPIAGERHPHRSYCRKEIARWRVGFFPYHACPTPVQDQPLQGQFRA